MADVETLGVVFLFGVFLGFVGRPILINWLKRKSEQVNRKLQVLS